MNDKLYTPENCKLLGEFIGFESVENSINPPMRWKPPSYINQWLNSKTEFIHTASFLNFFGRHPMASELIREALAREEVLVIQRIGEFGAEILLIERDHDVPHWEIGNEYRVLARAPWDVKNSPTGRDELFAATVEYLEDRK